jgi:iron complex transport system substrate-binding protein
MRICSLLPSATEMVFALGMGDSLVGITHECDYPPEALRIPHVTRSNIPEGLSSDEIDRMVSSNLATQGTLYELDQRLLDELAPDLILTQRLCDVCAVAYDKVQEVAHSLSSHPKVVNLEPHELEDILLNIKTVGSLIGAEDRASELVGSLRQRIAAIEEKTKSLASHLRPRVFCMEWVNPPYCGGHWMKTLVELAGGVDELARAGRPSTRIEWERVLEFSPEVMVLTCCGYKLPRVIQEAETLARYPGFHDLPAAKANRVFATNGSDYFSRPGPRIIDSLEILAHLVHPEIFPAPPIPPHRAKTRRVGAPSEQAFAAVDFARTPV